MDSLPAVLAGEDLLHLRVLWADRFVIGTTWNTRDVCSSYWRFYVNSRDGASLLTDVGRYPLGGGHIHFVPAWVRFTCHNTTDLDHLFVHFDPIGLPGALVRELFPSPRSLTPDADLMRACRRLGDDLHERALPAAALLCRIKSLVFTALAGLFASLPAVQARRCFAVVERRKAVHPALAHIEDRLGDPISNRQLAALCAMTEDRFIRRFRDEVGQTPAQFVLERRVSTAAQRLLFTDDSIDAIAERSGFANRFHFSRIFAARMGAPPAAYRRKGRA